MKKFLALVCLSAITVAGCDQVKIAKAPAPKIYVKCHYKTTIVGFDHGQPHDTNEYEYDHLYTLILGGEKPMVISGKIKYGNDGQDILGHGHITHEQSISCENETSDKTKGICDYTAIKTSVSQNNDELTFTFSSVYGPDANTAYTSSESSETINLIDGTLTGSYYDYNKFAKDIYRTKWAGQCRKINREIGG